MPRSMMHHAENPYRFDPLWWWVNSIGVAAIGVGYLLWPGHLRWAAWIIAPILLIYSLIALRAGFKSSGWLKARKEWLQARKNSD